MKDTYQLLDSGEGRKLERFGPYVISRPASQAIWKKSFLKKWENCDASFSRKEKEGWHFYRDLPASWDIKYDNIIFTCRPTSFGHLGLFPEHQKLWQWMQKKVQKNDRILNLFAYTGGATIAALQKGAQVCHVDASKPAVAWAQENVKKNFLSAMPVRWIVDDVIKFLKREFRRNHRYDGIILDPPSFGRGASNQVFIIEKDLFHLLELCRSVLDKPKFFILSCHSLGLTPLVLEQIVQQVFQFKGGKIEKGEQVITGSAFVLPSGFFVRWCNA